MNTVQINFLLSNYDCFIGTFPRDLLPKNKITKRPCALVINTDDSLNPGQHWVALFLRKNGTAEYFDSFGFSIMHKDIINFLRKNNIDNIIYNPKQLQSVSMSTCGAYCVLFVKYLCSDFTFCDFIKYFSNNKINNDIKATLSLML
jgi:hypothetical protein